MKPLDRRTRDKNGSLWASQSGYFGYAASRSQIRTAIAGRDVGRDAARGSVSSAACSHAVRPALGSVGGFPAARITPPPRAITFPVEPDKIGQDRAFHDRGSHFSPAAAKIAAIDLPARSSNSTSASIHSQPSAEPPAAAVRWSCPYHGIRSTAGSRDSPKPPESKHNRDGSRCRVSGADFCSFQTRSRERPAARASGHQGCRCGGVDPNRRRPACPADDACQFPLHPLDIQPCAQLEAEL